MDLRPACAGSTFTRVNKRPQSHRGGYAGVDGLGFWWCLFFRIFGHHQARNVQRHRASFFLGLVPEAAAHGSGNLLARKPALVEGRAGLERLVAALIMTT